MAILRSGDRVTVYSDPLTEEQSEGEATLQSFVALSPNGCQPVTEQWQVVFDGDDSPVERTIKRYGKNNRTFGYRVNEPK